MFAHGSLASLSSNLRLEIFGSTKLARITAVASGREHLQREIPHRALAGDAAAAPEARVRGCNAGASLVSWKRPRIPARPAGRIYLSFPVEKS